MPPFTRQASFQDLRTVCDVINDAASFTQPEVTRFPDGSTVVRFWINPEVVGVAAGVDHCWYLREVNIDRATGEPASLQYSPEPFMVADQHYSPRQAAMCMVQYLIARLGATAQNTEMPADSRNYAARALQLIMARTEAGPPAY